MSEFHIIGLGNLCEFVIKNIDEKQTYGTFSACDKHDRKSMQEFVDYVNQLIKEKEKLKERIKELQKESYGNLDGLNYYQEENASLSEKISNLEYDLDYFRAKNGSLEEGLFQQDRKIAKLEKENKELKELVSEVDNELEIRDIVCGAGKFRLEEWGKHRYHQFYKGDEELEDETVVIMLIEFEKENKELKKELGSFKPIIFETENGATTLYEKENFE